MRGEVLLRARVEGARKAETSTWRSRGGPRPRARSPQVGGDPQVEGGAFGALRARPRRGRVEHQEPVAQVRTAPRASSRPRRRARGRARGAPTTGTSRWDVSAACSITTLNDGTARGPQARPRESFVEAAARAPTRRPERDRATASIARAPSGIARRPRAPGGNPGAVRQPQPGVPSGAVRRSPSGPLVGMAASSSSAASSTVGAASSNGGVGGCLRGASSSTACVGRFDGRVGRGGAGGGGGGGGGGARRGRAPSRRSARRCRWGRTTWRPPARARSSLRRRCRSRRRGCRARTRSGPLRPARCVVDARRAVARDPVLGVVEEAVVVARVGGAEARVGDAPRWRCRCCGTRRRPPGDRPRCAVAGQGHADELGRVGGRRRGRRRRRWGRRRRRGAGAPRRRGRGP